jgi:PAS domain-containing protein/HAMP domain-containing protein
MASGNQNFETKKKGFVFSKFFRVDFKTIQGRVTGAFLLVALVATLMLVFNSLSWKRVNDKYIFVVENIYPSKSLISKIRGSLAGAHALTGQYVSSGNLAQRKSIEEIINMGILPSLLKLDSLSQNWPNSLVKREAFQLQAQLKSFSELQAKVIDDRNEEVWNSVGYINQYNEILSACSQLTTKLDQLEKEAIDEGDRKKDNIAWIMLIQYAFAFVISFGIASFILISLLSKVRFLKKKIREMAKGDLIEELPSSQDELNTITTALNELVTNLRSITDFASEVGKGEFESEISVFNNEGDLGRSLAEMRDSLKKVAEEDKRRVWINEGIAKFGDMQRSNNNSIEQLSDAILGELVKYVNANQGSVFIVEEDPEKGKRLVMKATYAFDRKKFLEKEILPGQGLVGQCYFEKETVHLSEVPDGYVNITSGLGDATPDHLLIVPMKIDQDVFGVIELASFYPFHDHVITFIERIAENLASTLQSVKINEGTTKLLEDSQMRSEQLLAQEEEMRQNVEEMQATQEEMTRLKNQSDYIFDNIDGAVFMCDNDANFTMEFMSQGVYELTGYQAAEFTSGNLSIVDIFSEETKKYQKEWIDDLIDKALKNDTFYRLEYSIYNKKGDLVHVVEKGKGVRDKSGNVIKLVGFISKL